MGIAEKIERFTVPNRFDIFLVELNFREVPKSITLMLAFGFLESRSKFSGFKSLKNLNIVKNKVLEKKNLWTMLLEWQ